MKKQQSKHDGVSTVRIVLSVQPGTASYIRTFPKRKRSLMIEELIQNQMSQHQREKAYEALMKARERLKGTSTTEEVVEWLREDRKSH
ncbi:MAG: hypothetical protein Q8O95_04845 [bacterium]|nr:hypothetical protein [bacterium]